MVELLAFSTAEKLGTIMAALMADKMVAMKADH